MPNVQMKVISSLEKCFYDEKLRDKQEKNEFIMFLNEKLSRKTYIFIAVVIIGILLMAVSEEL